MVLQLQVPTWCRTSRRMLKCDEFWATGGRDEIHGEVADPRREVAADPEAVGGDDAATARRRRQWREALRALARLGFTQRRGDPGGRRPSRRPALHRTVES